MKLQDIRIYNYRGFQHSFFELDPQFTVFIGDNGTGKTSILDACAVAIGSFFLGIDIVRSTESKNIGRDDVYLKQIEGQPRPQLPAVIMARGIVNDRPIKWARNVDEFTKKTTTKYSRATNIKKVAQNMLKESRKTGKVNFPVIAYHGTGRLWAQHENPKYVAQKEGVEMGYKNALSAKSDSKAFLSWYKTYEDEVQKFNRPMDRLHLKTFKITITSLVKQWTNMAYSRSREDLVGTYTDKEGKRHELAYSQLSDGYRNAIGIAADIAYRCIQLNPHLKDKAIKESEGIVLIDEIDLHLHPNWQQNIVADLKRVFPKIQFIATTHSPFIVQSLTKKELVNLDTPNQGEEEDPFKQSIEDVAEVMQVKHVPRSVKFNEMVETAAAYYDLIQQGEAKSEGEIVFLREKLNELEARYSEDAAFVALLRAERKSRNL